MKNIRLSKETKKYLVGKEIIDCGDDYITLDNGCRIYLDESEIDNLGSERIEREFDDHDSSLLYGTDNN
jgi:hypothetical protein